MINKRYVKSRDAMKVTFTVDFAPDAKAVEVAGDFSEWTPLPMKRLKNGVYKTTVDLSPGQAYQYRYLIDGAWENDRAADGYVPNGFGEENSLVVC